MSRTRHHSTKHGPLAFGKGHRQRCAGEFNFGTRRPGNRHYIESPGRATKTLTHRRERRAPLALD